MRIICFFLFLLAAVPSTAQIIKEEPKVEKDSVAPIIDPLYREDQFYASIAYNMMQSKPQGYTPNSISLGITAGFLRDIPVNEARNHAIAIGLGYSYNNIKNNLFVSGTGDQAAYSVLPEEDFSKNKLVLHYLELPIEFRWRNSNAISHKFWRVYTGFKVSYLVGDKAQHDGIAGDIKIRNNKDLNDFVFGAYISAGWNTWNFYAYYGFTSLYKSGQLDTGENIKLNSLNLGMVFYIL